MLTVGQFRAWSLLVVALAAAAQTPPAPQTPPPSQPAPEMSSRDEPATFKTRVNLVLVPVVVRDRNGRAVTGLTKDDFRLFDKGKPQEISRFTVETLAKPTPIPETNPLEAANPLAKTPEGIVPDRFIAYLFDDVHLDVGDLMQARNAAQKHMNNELRPSDRAAVFTTSGQTVLDFTDDLTKLHEVLFTLKPHPIARIGIQDCPDIGYYQANQIINVEGGANNGGPAARAAIQETIICLHLDPQSAASAPSIVDGKARSVLSQGDQETRVSLSVLMDVVRRMSAMPGQRVIVLSSGGFLTLAEHQAQLTDVLDRAVRGNIIINTLNARGLYTDSSLDPSKRTISLDAQRVKSMLNRQEDMLMDGFLAELAAGTGGRYFHNNNDLGEGFHELAAPPEVYYLLGFQPQNLKLDGAFHAIKVTLAAKADITLQARRGYYAPRHLEDPEQTAEREIQEALFSREELRDIPVELHTQFFKSGANLATATVLAHLDLRHVKFREVENRNVGHLLVMSGLFDRNGNFIKGLRKTIDFNLRPETLQRRLDSGITVRSSIEVEPGTYVVRLIVRDSDGQTMSAINGVVDIPLN